MKVFDTQRVESLMRYAEFLESMEADRKMIERVIEIIHEEVVGYVKPVETTKLYADGFEDEVINSLHPDVEEMIHQEVTKQVALSLKASDDVKQFLNKLNNND